MATPVPGVNVVSWQNIAATPAAFQLAGGRYQFTAIAASWGTATLQVLGPDNTTLLTVTNAALSANGYVNFEIGEGQQCTLTLSGVTGFYGAIARIPLSPAA